MLTRAGCDQRVGELLDRLSADCQAIVLTHPCHVNYLSGFLPSLAVLNEQKLSFLVVAADGQTTLIADNWQAGAARACQAHQTLIYEWYDETRPAKSCRQLAVRTLLEHLRSVHPRLRGVGVETSALPFEAAENIRQLFRNVTLNDISEPLTEMRKCKHEDEIESIREAVRACEAGFSAVQQELGPGMTELEACASANAAALNSAGLPIVAGGDFISGLERCAAGSGLPTSRVMQAGELLIMDFFLSLRGYHADLCRTLSVSGRLVQEQSRRLAILDKAKAAAEEQLRPGAKAAQIYKALPDVVAGEGLAGQFWGHAGHGIGLDHPESPFIVAESEEELEYGNVVTLEPGLYLEGWGGMRIEDDYLITTTGYERLSSLDSKG
ncbi:MAG: Xaa-Pro peptidase family protein [Acidobacteriota bacterium]